MEDPRIKRAVAHLKEGMLDDAVDAFTEILKTSPHNPQALQGRATALFHMKKWDAAEADFGAAKKADESDPNNWSGLALSQAMQNKVYPALALFETLLKKWPDFTEAWIQVGLLCIKIGAIAKGRDHLQMALNNRPTLDQRRRIETTLREQEKLDANRYYRPDFERLRTHSRRSPFIQWIEEQWKRVRRPPASEGDNP